MEPNFVWQQGDAAAGAGEERPTHRDLGAGEGGRGRGGKEG